MLRGGDDLGAAIVPGKPDESPLIEVLHEGAEYFMPKKRDPLPEEDVALLRRWIEQGARDDTPQFPAEDIAFFEREIRPLLFERCFKCHAGEDPESGLHLTSRHGIIRGGEHGPAAIPGEPSSSRLIAAVKHEGDLKMPRGGDRLSAREMAALEMWISRGMPWPDDSRVLTREKLFTISDADREHWSFRPLPVLPDEWSIDRTLEKHHREAGIQPAPRATRHQLLRRLSYDLIGYPPTREEIEAFLSDDSPDAYEKVVDRLLASPHFGWRWGRHWIDYTRNGSSSQPNRGPDLGASQYAAWVAESLNRDHPWDWFARVHLAGDRLPSLDGSSYSIDQAMAAAVPLNGPRTFQEAGTETFVLMDKLDEGVEFLGRSLLGISLECARCHDHKFDPVSQRDYYALLGFFQSSWYAPAPIETNSLAEADKAIANYRALVAERARLSGFVRREGTKLNVGGGGRVKIWKEKRAPDLAPRDKRLRELELAVFRGELAAAKKTGDRELAADLQTSVTRLETRLTRHKPPEYHNFGALSFYKTLILGSNSQRGLLQRAKDLEEDALARELEAQAEFWETERSTWVERARYGGFARTDPEVKELAEADDRIRDITAILPIDPSKPWDPPREGYRIVRSEGGLRRAEDLAALDEAAEAAGLQFNRNHPDRVRMHPYYIGDSRLLRRGDVLEADDLIARAFPEFFGGNPLELDGSGRVELAQWLTSEESIQASLLARATANRAWQNLFGEALCRTPKELGRLGHTPEMPDLLDGLAAEFIAHDWSLKSLLRTIVSSDAYARSASVSEENQPADPQNVFFARQNVIRLEAEAVMNTFASLRHGRRFATPALRDKALSGFESFLTNFDGPTTDDLIDRRTASISSSQALFLLNAGTAYSQVCQELGKRLMRGKDAELIEVLDDLFLEVLQRHPTDVDREFAVAFVERRRAQGESQSPSSEIREFIHLLLCSNELLYLD